MRNRTARPQAPLTPPHPRPTSAPPPPRTHVDPAPPPCPPARDQPCVDYLFAPDWTGIEKNLTSCIDAWKSATGN